MALNKLFIKTNDGQTEIEYSPSGVFRIGAGNWVKSPKAIALEAKSNANGYAVIACSNCGKPIQSVRDRKIKGLRKMKKGAAHHPKLYSPLPGIEPDNEGQCWHGKGSC